MNHYEVYQLSLQVYINNVSSVYVGLQTYQVYLINQVYQWRILSVFAVHQVYQIYDHMHQAHQICWVYQWNITSLLVPSIKCIKLISEAFKCIKTYKVYSVLKRITCNNEY